MNCFVRFLECCDTQKDFSVPTISASQSTEIYGVGIGFLEDMEGALVVTRVTPAGTWHSVLEPKINVDGTDVQCASGPAFRSGIVQVGDILYEIDGEPVFKLSPAQVSPRMLGQKGSTVMLVFLRGDKKIAASLQRQLPASATIQQLKNR